MNKRKHWYIYGLIVFMYYSNILNAGSVELMKIRQVQYELEAKLTSKVSGLFSKPTGKIERKSYRDSVERIKITLRNLKVPDNSLVTVTSDGNEIAQVSIVNGSGRVNDESPNSDTIPALKAGQLIEVHFNGIVMLFGKLYED